MYSKYFQLHPDGWVTVTDGVNRTDNMSLEDFRDLEPGYRPPIHPYNSEFYAPPVNGIGGEHWVHNGRDQMRLGTPWDDGDVYIRKVDEYIKARSAQLGETS